MFSWLLLRESRHRFNQPSYTLSLSLWLECSHYIRTRYTLTFGGKKSNQEDSQAPSGVPLSFLVISRRHSSRMPKGACVSFPTTIMAERFEQFKHIAFPRLELLAWNPCSLWRPPRTTCCMPLAYSRHGGQLLVLAALLTHHPIVWVLPVLTV